MRVSTTRRAIATSGSATFASIGLLIACASDAKTDEPREIPGRSSSSGGEDGAANTETGAPTLDCSGSVGVSDNPACATCAKTSCCKQIKDCEEDTSCAAIQQCLAACDPADPTCGLTCILANQAGSEKLQAVAGCATTKCKSSCGGLDAGDVDSPF